eukprot:CAMPEP_0118804294 /NCGR_PEP_ID=MMETSP1161-20130426/22094_1 /TAXON_ID=249345 /ORGANISM="Picochlorum oklahomensis, Strain CCMP2329" /LENGTH=157 /DNA_ID=CAMNT_0006733015 /DNA_START=139 /DNA_END=608 /DNA_ORIENTATION=-
MKLAHLRRRLSSPVWLIILPGLAVLSLPTPLLSHGNEALSPDCGHEWQKEYANLHREILDGRLPARYVISVAVEAGIADRLSGLMSEFYYALLSGRAIKMITYGDLPDFSLAYDQPYINWSGVDLDDNIIEPLKYTYKGVRGYAGDRGYVEDVDTKA